VAGSPCRSYVTWYNKVSSGNWATWEPGTSVSAGCIGTFDGDLRFHTYRTLRSLGVHAVLSREQPIGPRYYRLDESLRLKPKLAGESPSALNFLGQLDAGLRITADRAHACVLYMVEPTERSIRNVDEVMDQVLALLREGRWAIDWVLVLKRMRSRRGFAAISTGSGQSLELKASGHLQAVTSTLDLGSAEFAIPSSHASSDFLLFPFGEESTPVFGPPLRVKRALWHRLLPWSRDGYQLIDPAGNRYPPRYVPADLSAFPPDTRRFHPSHSAMPLAELSAMTAREIFEEVTSPADEQPTGDLPTAGLGRSGTVSLIRPALAAPEVRNFPLPQPEERAAIAAAGSERDVPVLLDTSSPDGTADFTLYDRDKEYWLEVTLTASVQLPAIVHLRYGMATGAERELLIPVADDGTGQPSSVVRLEGYWPRSAWHATLPLPPQDVVGWHDDVIAGSIRAAATEATIQAWDHLVTLVQPDAAALILREINARRNLS
jgi:hypothetical protein